ncbi:MAG: hypothetical protein MI754_04680 [Chromatiales bacterium]|nr:hypothetical protein [Chromatiales bacterium]
MADNRYRFQIFPSKQLTLFFYLTLYIPLFLIALVELPLLPKLLLLTALALMGLLHNPLQQRNQNTILFVEYQGGDDWQIALTDGTLLQGKLEEGSYISQLLMILRFRYDGRRRLTNRIVLFPDALKRGEFRRLRLRIGRLLKRRSENDELTGFG